MARKQILKLMIQDTLHTKNENFKSGKKVMCKCADFFKLMCADVQRRFLADSEEFRILSAGRF